MRNIGPGTAELHHHAELQLVLARDAVLLRLELIHIPLAVDETPRRPWPVLFGKPDANSTAESDVIFEHYISEVSLVLDRVLSLCTRTY